MELNFNNKLPEAVDYFDGLKISLGLRRPPLLLNCYDLSHHFFSSDLLLLLNPPHVSHLILISDLVILIALHVIFYFFRHYIFYFVSYV